MSFKASQSVSAKSKYGYLKVFFSREEGIRGYLNERQIFTDLDDFRISEPLVVPGIMSGNIEKVLIIGGSDGLVASKVVEISDCESVDVVWDDDSLVEICKQIPEMNMLNNSAYFDHRIDFIFKDVQCFVSESMDQYDLVIIDTYLPDTPVSNVYYTREFFELLKSVMHSKSRLMIKTSMMVNYYNSVCATLKRVFKNIRKYWVNAIAIKNVGFVVASDYKLVFDKNKMPSNLDFLNRDYFDTLFIFPKDKEFFLENDEENTLDDVYLPFTSVLYKYIDPEELVPSNFANFVLRESILTQEIKEFRELVDVFLYRNNFVFEIKSKDEKLMDMLINKEMKVYRDVYVYMLNIMLKKTEKPAFFSKISAKNVYKDEKILTLLYKNTKETTPRWLAEHDATVMVTNSMLNNVFEYYVSIDSSVFIKTNIDKGLAIIDIWMDKFEMEKEKQLMGFIKAYCYEKRLNKVALRSNGISLDNLEKQVNSVHRLQLIGERKIFSNER